MRNYFPQIPQIYAESMRNYFPQIPQIYAELISKNMNDSHSRKWQMERTKDYL
jgi:hypothetical protein